MHEIQKYDGFPDGTYLRGTVLTRYSALVRTFGEPHYFLGDKTNVEWVVLIDGVVVHIYDWKMDSPPLYDYEWHIGGSSDDSREVALVKSALADTWLQGA